MAIFAILSLMTWYHDIDPGNRSRVPHILYTSGEVEISDMVKLPLIRGIRRGEYRLYFNDPKNPVSTWIALVMIFGWFFSELACAAVTLKERLGGARIDPDAIPIAPFGESLFTPDRKLENTGPSTNENLINQAIQRIFMGFAGEAVVLLEKLPAGQMDTKVKTYYAMALCLCDQKGEAAKAFAGLEIEAVPIDLLYQLATIFDGNKMESIAQRALETVYNQDPGFQDVAARIGRLKTIAIAGGPDAFERALVESIDPRFSKVKILANGTMGVVLSGHDSRRNVPVAIKLLSPFLRKDEGSIARFRREAETLGELNHPCIVSIFDLYLDGDCPYYTMELVEAQTLHDEIHGKTPLSVETVLSIARLGLEGLDYCHNQQIIHRDIKPHNILVPGKNQLRIVDFGLVKVQDVTKMTRTGTILGTPVYMSPEQVCGEVVNHRADLYSFGVVIYEMLVRRVPFEMGENLHHEIVAGRFIPPSIHRKDLPRGFDGFIARAMNRRPEARFESGAEMTRALEDCFSRNPAA